MTVESPAFVSQVLLLMPLSQLTRTVYDCRNHSLGEKMLIAICDEEYEEYPKKVERRSRKRTIVAWNDFSRLLDAHLFWFLSATQKR